MAQMQFKPILPKKFNVKALMAEVIKEMKEIHRDIGKDFDATVSTWDHQPKFERKLEQSARYIRSLNGTRDEIYGYVSRGTRPHLIRPKRARVLAFQGGTYTAKSSPGTIKAKHGGASGATVFSRGVHHPGSKARGFPEAIAKKWKSPFPKRMQKAVDRGVKKSGHAMK